MSLKNASSINLNSRYLKYKINIQSVDCKKFYGAKVLKEHASSKISSLVINSSNKIFNTLLI